MCNEPSSTGYVDYSLSHTGATINKIEEDVPVDIEVRVTFDPLKSGMRNPIFQKDYSLFLWLSLSPDVKFPM